QELRLWLHDLLRRGLAEAQAQPHSFWETPASRMVDSQVPGAARVLREMSGIPASGDGWPARLLERAGRLHLLAQGFKRLAELAFYPSAFTVRAAIGVRHAEPQPLADFPAHPTVTAALAAHAAALGANPWLEAFPFALGGVVPARSGSGWTVRDAEARLLPL